MDMSYKPRPRAEHPQVISDERRKIQARPLLEDVTRKERALMKENQKASRDRHRRPRPAR
jgi:hypothetical protein